MSVVSGGLQSGGGAAVLILPGATGTDLTLSSTATALKFVSTQASGSDALEMATGARVSLNTANTVWIESNATPNMRFFVSSGLVLTLDATYAINTAGPIRAKAGGVSTATMPSEMIGAISSNVTPVSSATAGPNDLITFSLVANALNANARGIRITAWGTTTNNANAKTLTMNFGGTALISQAMTANQASGWKIVAEVFRTGAATQTAIAQLVQGGATTIATATSSSPGETLSGAVTVKCTATNEITQNGMLVEYISI